MRLRRAARVILVGAPGVGKGTQSERLLKRYPQLAHLSSGDLLRHNIKMQTPLGVQVENIIKAGGLVPDDVILRLIRNELASRGWLGRKGAVTQAVAAAAADAFSEKGQGRDADTPAAAPGTAGVSAPGIADVSAPGIADVSDAPDSSFLLDGFPRTAAQAEQLDQLTPINLVVSIKTPFEVVLQRISGRWVHEPSGRVYNETFNAPRVPGRDDITGEPLVRRPDDSPDVYRERFRKFTETSTPLLAHYAAKGVLLEVEGMSSDEITPKLYDEFDRRFGQV